MTMREFEVEIECIWKPREVELIRLNNKGRCFSAGETEKALWGWIFSVRSCSLKTPTFAFLLQAVWF